MKSINIKNLKLVTLYFLLAFLCFSVAYQANITPSVQRPITLQSNSTHYPLHRPIYQALEQAKHSITIYSYSISDQKIIRLLNKKFKEGLNIKIFYDFL